MILVRCNKKIVVEHSLKQISLLCKTHLLTYLYAQLPLTPIHPPTTHLLTHSLLTHSFINPLTQITHLPTHSPFSQITISLALRLLTADPL